MNNLEKALMIRWSADRGHSSHGWLESRHTFSFGEYYDPSHMGFRSLRVINDDHVAPGMGFGTHPHRDMEIFSYVLEGALEHRDSLGNGRRLERGDVQLMSAGAGIQHSEFNPSKNTAAHFLQIWIQPSERGIPPSYTEWKPGSGDEQLPKVLLISPDARGGSARIHQDAFIYRIRLQHGEEVSHEIQPGRGFWLHVFEGQLELPGVCLSEGDAVGIEAPGLWKMKAAEAVGALLFDLA